MLNQTTLRFVVGFLLTACALIFLPATAYGEVRLNPQEEIVRIGRMNEPLPVDILIRSSLIASGVGDENLETYIRRLITLVDSAPPASGDNAADGEVLLQWMHDEILSRYIEPQTSLDVLLDRGTYNCVSSAVLYLILARSRDIPVHGVLTNDHAFCRIPGPDRDDGIDVETTTAYGFDPGIRKDAVDSFTGRTGFSYVPPGNYRQRRNIDEKELISLIYQNRISALQKSGRWDDTIGLSRDRWELSGSESAETDFRTSITNYAAEMDRKRKQLEGLRFLNDAALSLGNDHGLENTASSLLGNAVAFSLRAGRIDDAEAILDDSELTALVPGPFVDQRRRDVAERKLEIVVKSGDFDEAVSAADAAWADGLIDRGRWEEFTLYLWSTEARRTSNGGKWVDGWRFLNAAPSRVQSISRWDAMEETYRHNAIITYHNRFADALRRKSNNDAREILDEALGLFPDAPVLQQDRLTLDTL